MSLETEETDKKSNPLKRRLGDINKEIDWHLTNTGKIVKERLNEHLQPISDHLPANIIVWEQDMTEEIGDNLVFSIEFNMRNGSLEEVTTQYRLTDSGCCIPRRIRTDPLPLSKYPNYAFLVMDRAVELYDEVDQGKIEAGCAMVPQYPSRIKIELSTY